jgi:hypothetical protein
MSLIKKRDVPAYFAARRALRLGSIRGLSRPGGTAVTASDPAGAGANASKSAGITSLEQSASSALVPPKE